MKNNYYKLINLILSIFLISLIIFIDYKAEKSNGNVNNTVITKNSVKKEDYLTLFLNMKQDILKNYVIKNMDNQKQLKIDCLLMKASMSPKIVTLKNVPKEIRIEIIKSVLLYIKIFKNKNSLFYSEKNNIKRINKLVALLESVAKIETGYVFNYDHREFSKTGAYGRYQIIAPTLSSISLTILLNKSIDFGQIKYEKTKTFYNYYQKYVSEINQKYSKKYNEKWDNYLQNKQLRKTFKYVKDMNNQYEKILNNNLKHYRYRNKKEYNLLVKDMSSIYKRYKLSTQILVFIKNPVNQGILSLKILEDIYLRQRRKDMKIVYNTFKYYNNDKHKINKKEVRVIYANNAYKEYLNTLNE